MKDQGRLVGVRQLEHELRVDALIRPHLGLSGEGRRGHRLIGTPYTETARFTEGEGGGLRSNTGQNSTPAQLVLRIPAVDLGNGNKMCSSGCCRKFPQELLQRRDL